MPGGLNRPSCPGGRESEREAGVALLPTALAKEKERQSKEIKQTLAARGLDVVPGCWNPNPKSSKQASWRERERERESF